MNDFEWSTYSDRQTQYRVIQLAILFSIWKDMKQWKSNESKGRRIKWIFEVIAVRLNNALLWVGGKQNEHEKTTIGTSYWHSFYREFPDDKMQNSNDLCMIWGTKQTEKRFLPLSLLDFDAMNDRFRHLPKSFRLTNFSRIHCNLRRNTTSQFIQTK